MTDDEHGFETITDGWGRVVRLPAVKHRVRAAMNRKPEKPKPVVLAPAIPKAEDEPLPPLPPSPPPFVPKTQPRKLRERVNIVIGECPECHKRRLLGKEPADPTPMTSDHVFLVPCAVHRKVEPCSSTSVPPTK